MERREIEKLIARVEGPLTLRFDSQSEAETALGEIQAVHNHANLWVSRHGKNGQYVIATIDVIGRLLFVRRGETTG